MRVAPPATLFGLSRGLERQEAADLSLFLSRAWTLQFGKPPMALKSDLSYLEKFFAPTSTSRRLREAVAAVPQNDFPRPSSLTPELFLDSRAGRGLVTPEGRVTLHLLEGHRGQESVVFEMDEVAWAYRIIADLYREWGRDRLLEALGIIEHPLRLPVIAFNIVLAVNGSVGEEKALPVPTEENDEQELSRVIAPIVDAFVESLHPQRRRSESFRLRGGWILSETSRHLFDYVVYDSSSIWIRPNRLRPLLRRLARELARDKKRKKRTGVDVERAFASLVEAYSDARPALASRGAAYQRNVKTREIEKDLLSYFDEAATPYGYRRLSP